jgi:hypothetical protein
MAHPFAEDDKLSALIGGGVWNLSDSDFPENDEDHPSYGTVICNNTEAFSDVYAEEPVYVFSERIFGGQVWNLRNELATSDESENPWDVMYSESIDPFVELGLDEKIHHKVRLNQNMDVMNHVWKKALLYKSMNEDLLSWKLFMSAGSDAHGSFNYSNTDMYYGTVGSITDNAIGKLSTLAYCPDGMGADGKNILLAMQNGHTVLSSGPVVTMKITNNLGHEAISGDDIIIDDDVFNQYNLEINAVTTPEYGAITSLMVYVYSSDTMTSIAMPISEGMQALNLQEAIEEALNETVALDEYLMIRAELITTVDYDTLAAVHARQTENFMSLTNPIWFKVSDPLSAKYRVEDQFKIYPNPAKDKLRIQSVFKGSYCFKIYNSQNQQVVSHQNVETVDLSHLCPGIYYIRFLQGDNISFLKFIKS